MLQLTGKCLGVETETVQGGPSGSFMSTKIAVLSGSGSSSRVEQVRVGREFPPADLPKADEDVTLLVVVGAYSGRNGAGYNLTALSRVKAGLRAAAV